MHVLARWQIPELPYVIMIVYRFEAVKAPVLPAGSLKMKPIASIPDEKCDHDPLPGIP